MGRFHKTLIARYMLRVWFRVRQQADETRRNSPLRSAWKVLISTIFSACVSKLTGRGVMLRFASHVKCVKAFALDTRLQNTQLASLCSEYSVAGIAEAGNYVCI